jgi:hypothetical protein
VISRGLRLRGWPATLTDEEILQRLVALNATLAAEEARGLIRWLRPDFQCPPGSGVVGASNSSTAKQTLAAIDSRPLPFSAAGSASIGEDSAPALAGKGQPRPKRGAKGVGSNPVRHRVC